MPGSLSHLTSRFFEVLWAKPLDIAELAAVESWLEPALFDVFVDQAPADQRHGYDAALRVLEEGVDDSDVTVAALMHDIGKRHAVLGVLGRSLTSVLILLGLPLSRRMTIYRDHGTHAARELAELRAPSLVIDYALHHHGARPANIDESTWSVLVKADAPTKAKWRRGVGIISTI